MSGAAGLVEPQAHGWRCDAATLAPRSRDNLRPDHGPIVGAVESSAVIWMRVNQEAWIQVEYRAEGSCDPDGPEESMLDGDGMGEAGELHEARVVL